MSMPFFSPVTDLFVDLVPIHQFSASLKIRSPGRDQFAADIRSRFVLIKDLILYRIFHGDFNLASRWKFVWQPDVQLVIRRRKTGSDTNGTKISASR